MRIRGRTTIYEHIAKMTLAVVTGSNRGIGLEVTAHLSIVGTINVFSVHQLKYP